MKSIFNSRIIIALLAVLLLAVYTFGACADGEAAETQNNGSVLDALNLPEKTEGVDDYDVYRKSFDTAPNPDTPVVLTVADVTEGLKSVTRQGTEYCELSDENEAITYSLDVKEAGAYNIEIVYLAEGGKMKNIVFSLYIDGNLPFNEAASVSLPRVFKDSGDITRDRAGNDIRPSQVEVNRINRMRLLNSDGYYNDPYEFYFSSEGVHKLTLKYSEEDVLISKISLVKPETLKSYKDYSKGAVESDKTLIKIEAENSFEKSSSMLYPTYDRSSPATSPSHYSKIRYNTIGQSNWAQQGQWISWKVKVPEDGWYSITFKARQNYQQGINSSRTLRIDGEIPFKEAKNVYFPYALNWYMKTVSNKSGDPYLFNLSKGEHTLSLEVSAGEMGAVLKGISDSVLDLNAIYRSIIMVTGTTPDIYRTYYLEESIPDLMDNIKSVRNELDDLYSQIVDITGTGGSEASIILEMKTMLDEFLDKPLEIQERVSAFKSTIESMGSVLLTLSTQPLELDYIIVSANSELPSASAGFFEFMAYSVKGFLASFVEDYNSISSSNDGKGTTTIKVWISNGRDQAQILKNLIDNDFTPQTGISVSLSLVSTAAGTSSSTLVQATLAGKGPDVALFTPKDTPINLAMRGALADLSEMSGFSDVYGRFFDSAWIPYKYNGGTYAVPETQNYDMLFYRTDIFEELGLDPPETWEDFYRVIEILQKSNLEMGVLETNSLNAGISSGISFFDKLLLQNGGSYYNSDLNKTEFNTKVAYDAFTDWTDLYSKYGLSRSFDFYNRFRSGEMPIGIMNYVTYNQLYSAAPEIRGLWKMVPIPGTPKTDGSIDRCETASGTASVILDQCKVKEQAWEFVKWWTDSAAQASYGTQLEATLGVAARYDTANIEAFDSIGWTKSESETLKSQWAAVTDIPQIPGNYFISRCLTNAFRLVVDEEENPVRALNIYNKDMNAEITRKRVEFDLE
ncbi:MAG: extracellular solute-binding protein [Clostridia bacterium]|nr:extracellular solute-binding protein [Clostridia bacterium]